MALKAFKADDNKIVGNKGDKANETVMNSFKKLTRITKIRATREPNILNLNAKKTFSHLQIAFIKASILWHFDLKNHIQIESNALNYIINRVLSQLNLICNTLSNDLNKSDFGQ